MQDANLEGTLFLCGVIYKVVFEGGGIFERPSEKRNTFDMIKAIQDEKYLLPNLEPTFLVQEESSKDQLRLRAITLLGTNSSLL